MKQETYNELIEICKELDYFDDRFYKLQNDKEISYYLFENMSNDLNYVRGRIEKYLRKVDKKYEL